MNNDLRIVKNPSQSQSTIIIICFCFCSANQQMKIRQKNQIATQEGVAVARS